MLMYALCRSNIYEKEKIVKSCREKFLIFFVIQRKIVDFLFFAVFVNFIIYFLLFLIQVLVIYFLRCYFTPI